MLIKFSCWERIKSLALNKSKYTVAKNLYSIWCFPALPNYLLRSANKFVVLYCWSYSGILYLIVTLSVVDTKLYFIWHIWRIYLLPETMEPQWLTCELGSRVQSQSRTIYKAKRIKGSNKKDLCPESQKILNHMCSLKIGQRKLELSF